MTEWTVRPENHLFSFFFNGLSILLGSLLDTKIKSPQCQWHLTFPMITRLVSPHGTFESVTPNLLTKIYTNMSQESLLCQYLVFLATPIRKPENHLTF